MADSWQETYKQRQTESEAPAEHSCGCEGGGGDCGGCGAELEELEEKEGGCSGSCSSCAAGSQCGSENEREQRLQAHRLAETSANIEHKILVLSGKGGVGKSTVSTNLAWALALRDNNWVGLLDADLHGPTIPLMMGLVGERAQPQNNKLLPVTVMSTLKVMSMGFLIEDPTTPVIWRGAIRANAIKQLITDVDWGHLNYLVVDLPPGTGDEALTVGQSFPDADGAIIVTTPQEASLEDCRKAINFVRQMNMPVLGVVENMSGFVCPHCQHETDIFSSGGGEQMAMEMNVPFLGRVPIVAEVAAMGDAGRPLVGNDAPVVIREAFAGIVAKLMEGIKG